MNYQLRKNRFRSPGFKKLALLVAIFLIGGVIFSLFDKVIISAVSPFWQSENFIARNWQKTSLFFVSQDTLIEENIALKERLIMLEAKVENLERERLAEAVILELYGRTRRSGEIAATILAGPPQSPYDVLVIDAGLNEGVISNSSVFLTSGALLGQVIEVSSRFSRVKLFSSSGEKTNAILERGSVPVSLEGLGAGNFRIILPRDTEIEKGDRILSSGIEGHLLALVEDVRLEMTDSFKTVSANFPANIFSLRLVLVEQ